MDLKQSVVCSILDLNLDCVVVADRPSTLRGVTAFPANVRRPSDSDSDKESAITPLLFPELVTANTNLSVNDYRQMVTPKFNTLQESLGVTFGLYIGSVRPNSNNVGVVYHYLLFYVPKGITETHSVEVNPELKTRIQWKDLDASALQKVLDSALAPLSVFNAKPYSVENVGRLLTSVDPSEYEVLLSAVTKIDIRQGEADEWYAPILQVDAMITAHNYQLNEFKKDDPRSVNDDKTAVISMDDSKSKILNEAKVVKSGIHDKKTLSSEINDMHNRFSEGIDLVKRKRGTEITDRDIETMLPKSEKEKESVKNKINGKRSSNRSNNDIPPTDPNNPFPVGVEAKMSLGSSSSSKNKQKQNGNPSDSPLADRLKALEYREELLDDGKKTGSSRRSRGKGGSGGGRNPKGGKIV